MGKEIKNMKDVTLYGWQADIVDMVAQHNSIREEEKYQGVTEWVVNKDLGITVVFPRGAGHTFLANYLASIYPVILVYHTHDNLQELTCRFPLNKDSMTISMFEIFYALNKPDVTMPSPEMVEMNKKFSTDKIIVVDNALRVAQQVKDYIYGLAQGPIVFLGH